jgi:hypothetical protein
MDTINLNNSKSSYLMEDINYEILINPTEMKEFTLDMNNRDMTYIPNFLTEDEVIILEVKIKDLRNSDILSGIKPQSVGTFILNAEEYKYICHHAGRYDIWNIAREIKTPDLLKDFTQKSIGCLLLDANTLIDGKYHKDTVELFEEIPNSQLPPFYYNMLIATCDQSIFNGPTTFYMNNKLYWVKLKRGDALIFNGEIIHRGNKNITDMNRDMIYAIYTKKWYDEEIL